MYTTNLEHVFFGRGLHNTLASLRKESAYLSEMSSAQYSDEMEALEPHGGVGPHGEAGAPVHDAGGVPGRPLEARGRGFRHALHRLRARVGDPDNRGVPLLLQLVGRLGGGAGVNNDTRRVVVRRVDGERFVRMYVRSGR